MDNILASIYQKIILKLGQPRTIELNGATPKFVFFIGPTGVGKTTTIAKIASKFKVSEKCKVALLTADTYRIAAVEQLRTYANILGIPLKVIYSQEELKQAKDEFSDYDIVFVDTAGRSHRSKEQRDDIEALINSIPEEDREIYLVLSATTKYRDLVKITETYSEIINYNLIFTKLDETSSIGNIFNIRMLTEAPLSYATFGQNVPDDISRIDAQSIAKQLLRGQ
jgi:flagellar biosynthesis protein FlhF